MNDTVGRSGHSSVSANLYPAPYNKKQMDQFNKAGKGSQVLAGRIITHEYTERYSGRGTGTEGMASKAIFSKSSRAENNGLKVFPSGKKSVSECPESVGKIVMSRSTENTDPLMAFFKKEENLLRYNNRLVTRTTRLKDSDSPQSEQEQRKFARFIAKNEAPIALLNDEDAINALFPDSPQVAIKQPPAATGKIVVIDESLPFAKDEQLPLAEVVSWSNAATSHLRELFSAAPRFLVDCFKILKRLFNPTKEAANKPGLIEDAIKARSLEDNKVALDSIFENLGKHEGLQEALVQAPGFLRKPGLMDTSNPFAKALLSGTLDEEFSKFSDLSRNDPETFKNRAAADFSTLLKYVAMSVHSKVQANHKNLTFTDSQEKFYNLALDVLMAAKGRKDNKVVDGLADAKELSRMIVCSLYGVEYLTPEREELSDKLINKLKVDIKKKVDIEWQKELEKIELHAEQESKEIDNII